jgi:hypothetical protein
LELAQRRSTNEPRRVPVRRATDTGRNIEGVHNQVGSPASLLIDAAKTVDEDVLDTFSRCTSRVRLFISSTGNELRVVMSRRAGAGAMENVSPYFFAQPFSFA